MRALMQALFPVLSGRVDTTLRMRALEHTNARLASANRRLAEDNARLRAHFEPCRRRQAEAHARLTAAVLAPTMPHIEEPTHAAVV